MKPMSPFTYFDDNGEEIKNEVIINKKTEIGDNDKEYLILLSYETPYYEQDNMPDGFYNTSWKFCTGRLEAYNFIKTSIINDIDNMIDLYNSLIMIDSLNMKDSITLYRFMEHCESIIEDDEFSIANYAIYEPQETINSDTFNVGNGIVSNNHILFDKNTNSEIID